MKTLDAHIFSLVEDPDMTFRELVDIVNAICLNRIQLDEKVDGQNFTLGFKNDSFCLMQKGNPDFNKAKYMSDLKDEIYHLSHSLSEKAGRLISIKKLMLLHLSRVNCAYKENKEKINIPDGVIIECAMLSKEFVNLIEYRSEHLGLVVLDVLGMEMDNDLFKMLGLMNIEPLEYKITNDWASELVSFLTSIGGYTLDSTIGDFSKNQVRQELIKIGIPDGHLDAFAKRVSLKNKRIVSHNVLKKPIWKKFQMYEKSGYLYRKSVQPIDLILFGLLEDVFKNTRNLMKIETDFEITASKLDALLEKDPTGDTYEVFKFQCERELIQPYLEFDFLNEGIVFSWKDKRYKITGAFTPINKINGFTLYKSDKIKFN